MIERNANIKVMHQANIGDDEMLKIEEIFTHCSILALLKFNGIVCYTNRVYRLAGPGKCFISHLLEKWRRGKSAFGADAVAVVTITAHRKTQ